MGKRHAIPPPNVRGTGDGAAANDVPTPSGGRKLTPVEGQGGSDATPAALDRLIHERIRLGIVSALAVHDALTFNELKSLMATTDGNLSVHARKLEDAGYIACTKSFAGRVPKTDYTLTTTGRAALERYLGHMEAIIRATKGQVRGKG